MRIGMGGGGGVLLFYLFFGLLIEKRKKKEASGPRNCNFSSTRTLARKEFARFQLSST